VCRAIVVEETPLKIMIDVTSIGCYVMQRRNIPHAHKGEVWQLLAANVRRVQAYADDSSTKKAIIYARVHSLPGLHPANDDVVCLENESGITVAQMTYFDLVMNYCPVGYSFSRNRFGTLWEFHSPSIKSNK